MKKQEANLREQKENLTHLKNQTEMLVLEKKLLKNQTEQLRRERDDLNHTLDAILIFDMFPVKDFCPNKSEFCTMRPLTTEVYKVTTDGMW